MSHLGDTISALVDGELTGADLDRANAHLAGCERCRRDATALRALKSQLRGLAADGGHDDLTLRLLAMGGDPRERGCGEPGCRGHDYREHDFYDSVGITRSPRRRYLVWSALSLAVVGGVGAAAFSMGGTSSSPDVVPQMQMFNVQHASISGDVPFPEPSQTPAARRKP